MKLPHLREYECGEEEIPDSDNSSNDGTSSHSEQSDASGSDYHHLQPSDNFLLDTSSDTSENAIARMLASPLQTYQQMLDSFSYFKEEDITPFSWISSPSTFPDYSVIPETPTTVTFVDEQMEQLILTDVKKEDQERPKIPLQVDNFIVDEYGELFIDATLPGHTFGFDLPTYTVQNASFLCPAEVTYDMDDNVINEPQLSLQRQSDERLMGDDVINDEPVQAYCYSTVEPFVLDSDFDYDSVSLTSKYSLEDLHSRHSYATLVDQ